MSYLAQLEQAQQEIKELKQELEEAKITIYKLLALIGHGKQQGIS